MIIVCQRLLKNTKINGITLFPFILIKNKALSQNPVLINHEKIHLRQQLELAILPFYVWYLAEFYLHRLKGKAAYEAYRAISFEREAYAQEKNADYLQTRRLWQFLDYIKLSQ